MAAAFFALLSPPGLGAVDYWFGMSGTGSFDNNSRENPILFSDYNFKNVIRQNPADPQDRDPWVVVNFMPGIYETGPLSFLLWEGQDYSIPLQAKLRNRRVTIKRAPDETGEVVFQLRPDGPSPELASAVLLSNYNYYPIERWEIENITFDCNWTGLETRTHPAYLGGLKIGALALNAYTGRLRNVKVRNYGANGRVPVPWFDAAGTETFPVFIHATDFRALPYAGDPTAWVVEDCEVGGFHHLHAGYCTAIMVTVGYPGQVSGQAVDDKATINGSIPDSMRAGYGGKASWWEAMDLEAWKGWRVATVRRCQIRGAHIGLGTAQSAGVVYSDNVVVSGECGFNTDTAHVRNLDFTNNVFLDVSSGGNIGGITSDTNLFRNYVIRSNVIRLARRPLLQNYANFKCNNGQNVSDTTLVLGRIYTNSSEGVRLAGASAIDFSKNRLTTRPRAWFHEPNPDDTAQAVFRAVWGLTKSTDYPWYTGTSITVKNDWPPGMDNVLLSATPFTFTGYSTLAAEGLTNQMYALAGQLSWAPEGRIGAAGRVQPVFDEQRLIGVNEVALGGAAINGDQVQVKAQWLYEPTYLDTVHPTTFCPSGSAASINFVVTHPPDLWAVPVQTSWSGDTATCAFYPSSSYGDGHYRVVAFVDGAEGNAGSWDPDTDYWSEVQHLHGATVRFVPTPDIANDRSRTNGMVALERTGSGQLTVKLRAATVNDFTAFGEGYTPQRFGELAAFATDYTLKKSSGHAMTQNQDGSFDVVFADGVTKVTVLVAPVYDQYSESEVVYFWVYDENQSYRAVASHAKVNTHFRLPRTAAVPIYDGPQWQIMRFTDFDPYPGPEAISTCINALNDLDNPCFAGYSWFGVQGYPYYYYRIGYWLVPPDWLMNKMQGWFTAAAEVRGISYDGLLAGVVGNSAIYGTVDQMQPYALPPLAAGKSTQAWGINPNRFGYPTYPGASYIVGAAQNESDVWRPTRWWKDAQGAWQVLSLGNFIGMDAASPGYAYAVNDQNQTVGISLRSVQEGNPPETKTYLQAFRTDPGATIGESSSPVLNVFPPVTSGEHTYYNYTNVARAINVVGEAAGGSQILVQYATYENRYRAAFWPVNSQDPVDLGVLPGGDTSEVLGLNSHPKKDANGNWQTLADGHYYSDWVEFVGWSNIQPGGASRRAIYGYYYPYNRKWLALHNLSDSHYVQGAASWTLQEARAINDQGWIVGVGAYQGRTRGFALAPLTPEP